MSEARLSFALERCLQSVRAGRSPEGALRLYPALRPELDGLLMSALYLGQGASASLPDAARAAMRSRIMQATRREPHGRRQTTAPLAWPALRLAFAPVAAILLALGAFLAFAAVRQTEAPSSLTVLTILGGGVQVETARGLVPGLNGMAVNEGDRILTDGRARAVITFFDGSTVVIEPGSDVTVSKVDTEDGNLRAVITQAQGSTWTHIPRDLGAAEVEIETPNARVETTQASVQTTVDHAGTQVGATDGPIAVESDTTRAEVPAGFNASVAEPGAVTDPQPAAQPVTQLVLRIDGPVYALLSDPGQAALGTVAPGVPVNQVPGARVERADTGAVLYVPNPAEGVYRLSLSASGDGPVSVAATLVNGGDSIQTSLDLWAGDSAGVSFTVQADDLTLLSAAREPVAAAAPPQVIVPQTAVDRASASATAAPATKTPTPKPTETQPPAATPTRTPAPTATPSPTPTKAPPKFTAVPHDGADTQVSSTNATDAAP